MTYLRNDFYIRATFIYFLFVGLVTESHLQLLKGSKINFITIIIF